MRTLAWALLAAAPFGQWPVGSPTVVEGFSPPSAAWAAGHRGVDLAATTGDAVLAMQAGTVAFVGTVAGKPIVTVSYPGEAGLRSTYEPVIASVRTGDAVREGQLLGTVALLGGHCGGFHGCLHVGLRTDDRYLDPLSLLERRPAVLKPLRLS